MRREHVLDSKAVKIYACCQIYVWVLVPLNVVYSIVSGYSSSRSNVYTNTDDTCDTSICKCFMIIHNYYFLFYVIFMYEWMGSEAATYTYSSLGSFSR